MDMTLRTNWPDSSSSCPLRSPTRTFSPALDVCGPWLPFLDGQLFRVVLSYAASQLLGVGSPSTPRPPRTSIQPVEPGEEC